MRGSQHLSSTSKRDCHEKAGALRIALDSRRGIFWYFSNQSYALPIRFHQHWRIHDFP
jgi:hypothetical protein